MQCTPELAFSSTGLFCLHFCNNRGCPNSKSTILRSDLIRERILKVQFEEILPPINKLLFEEIMWVWRDLSKVCELAFLSILFDDWMSLLMTPDSREPDNCPTVQFPDTAKIELSAYWIGYSDVCWRPWAFGRASLIVSPWLMLHSSHIQDIRMRLYLYIILIVHTFIIS